MKDNMLKDLLVVGSVTAALLFSQPVQGQNKEALNVSANSALSLLAEENISATPAKYAPVMDMATETDACFDLEQIGVLEKVRCIDYDLVYDDQTGEYGWNAALSAVNHPRQKLMTAGTDELVGELKVTTPSGGKSILLATDGYAMGQWAKGALVAYYYYVDANHPIVTIDYAAVLEKGHSSLASQEGFEEYAQPWIWIYAYVGEGESTEPIDCIEYMFSPTTGTQGWKSVTKDSKGRAAIWKDWTSVTFDLSKYTGKRVSFIFEVHDCAEKAYNFTTKQITLCSDHELAHLYTSVSCAPKQIIQTCAGANIKLTAPAGFKYKWYATNKPTQTLGNTQTISVSSTTATEYTCELTSDCETTKVKSTITPLTDTVNRTIIQGGSVEIDGHTYTEAGNESKTWTHIRHTDDNTCDVVVTVKLTVTKPAEPIHVYYERTIPQGVVFDFYGQDLTAEGDYEKTFKTATGNDSTVHLKLHILGETPKVDDEACFHMSTIGTTATAPTVAVESNLIKQTGTEQETFTWEMKIPSTPKRETYMTKEGLDELCPDLSLLPPGESTSIRLASEEYKATDMAKGSAVIFRYTIDASHPYVNIKYAGVLETPGHSIAIMPGFKEFAQPYMMIYWTIDGVEMEKRTYFPSDANSVKAWKSFTDRHGNKAIWLDWQSVHLDLSKYVGKTLAIAMEVYDCAEENYDAVEKQITLCSHHHLAHGYCHVNCELKKEECSGVASVAQPVCADAENFNIHVTHTMGTASAYDLLFSNAAKAQGFADVNNVAASAAGDILVTVPHAKKENSINGMSYPMPNTYDATVVAHTSCGYDVQMPVKFSLLYPKDIIVQRWNDVLAITNSTYNGGYNFSNIRWHHAGETDESLLQYVFGDHDSYLYMGNNGGTLVMGTEYWAELTREGESTGICTCHLIPQTVQNAGTKFAGVQLVASRDGSRRLELVTEESGVYSLYDVCGRVIQSGYFGQEYGVMDIDLTTASGNIFILKFVTNNGQQDSKKVMVY